MAKLPSESRVAVGPKPSGGKRTASLVTVAPSEEGHFFTGIDPERWTLPPAATVEGETLTEALFA
jgi:hypothetical protein